MRKNQTSLFDMNSKIRHILNEAAGVGLKQLYDYLNKTKEERYIELAKDYSQYFSDFVDFGAENQIIRFGNMMPSFDDDLVRQELGYSYEEIDHLRTMGLTNISDDVDFEDVLESNRELIIAYGEWIEDNLSEYEHYDSIPSTYFMTSPKMVRDQWMIHFTNHPEEIVKNGFRGVRDISKLGMTTTLNDQKFSDGFNFAYLLSDEWKSAYGKYQILFRASGVRVYHITDREYQVIFQGSSAKSMIPVLEGKAKRHGIWGKDRQELFFESDSLEAIVKWVKKNIQQYKNEVVFD